MALQFSETAPGVHTAVLTSPKTNKRHNIAIIESSNAWQLFIDGELAVRDLPSFKAAVAAADSSVTSQRSPNMVRAAGLLVVITVAGASFIGASKLIGAVLAPATVTAKANTLEKTSAAASQTFKRVKPRSTKAATAAKKLLAPAQPVVVNVDTDTTTKIASLTETAPATKVNVRRFSANNTVFGAKASPTQPSAAAKLAKPSSSVKSITAQVEPETVVAASPASKSGPEQSAQVEPVGREITIVPEQGPEPVITTDQDVGEALPALPTRAPVTARPLVRTATAPNDQKLLNEIEREEREQVQPAIVKRRSKPTRRVRIEKKRAEPKRSRRRSARIVKKKSRRRHTTAARSRNNRVTTRRKRAYQIRTAEVRRPRQSRRMVCFAHSCQFR